MSVPSNSRSIRFLTAQLRRLEAAPADAALCLSIQEYLVRRLKAIEGRLREARLRERDLKRLVGQRDPTRTRDHSNSVRAELAGTRELIREYQRMLVLLREFGDAIAHLYVDRFDLKPLCYKEPSGFLSGKLGHESEMAALREVVRSGRIGLLCDCTNVLRHGDLVVVDDDSLHLYEVKRSPRKTVVAGAQAERNSRVMQYLATDVSSNVYGEGMHVQRNEAPPFEHNVDQLNAILDRVRDGETVLQEVEDGLFYHVSRSVSDTVEPLRLEAMAGRSIRAAFVNEMKHLSAGYRPFPLTIRHSDDLESFYNGELFIIICVDMSVVTSAFAKQGIACQPDGADAWICRLTFESKDGPMEVRLGSHMWGRLYAEFASLRWIVAAAVQLCARYREIRESEVSERQAAG